MSEDLNMQLAVCHLTQIKSKQSTLYSESLLIVPINLLHVPA